MRDLFNQHLTEVEIKKPIRLIELFSGYSSQAMAMRRIGAPFEIWHTSEWLWQSNRSHLAVFHNGECSDHSEGMTKEEVVHALLLLGISTDEQKPMTEDEIIRKGEKWQRRILSEFRENRNLGSITNIHGADLEIKDKDKYCYMMTYSFPCQDISQAGKHKGLKKGEGTRSGLLWEVERILRELDREHRPDILFMENVPQLISASNVEDFNEWQRSLNEMGYHNYMQVLNAKNYGVPQNRERCFMFSFLDDIYYEFPKPIRLKTKMVDILENQVDEKYYLNYAMERRLIERMIEDGYIAGTEKTPCQLDKHKEGKLLRLKDAGIKNIDCKVSPTIMARYYKGVAGNGDPLVIEKGGCE